MNIKKVKNFLKNLEDMIKIKITFNGGWIYILQSVYQVDESEYNSDEYFVGTVVNKIKGKDGFFDPESLMQFNINDIKEIKYEKTGEIIYRGNHEKTVK